MHGLLAELVVAYAVGGVVVLLLHRVRVPPVVGFLFAGVLIGPHGLSVVGDVEGVHALADIGVVILLFTIGVETGLVRVARAGPTLLLAGSLQVVATTVAFALPLFLLRGTLGQAIAVGLLVMPSSTTLLLKTLGERGETDAPQGRVSIGISLVQDLAVVPVLILLPTLGGASGSALDTALALGKALAVVVGTVAVARLVVPRILEAVVDTRSRELFALTVIVLCLGTAWSASLAGLSLPLGAFLGGLVVAESPYSQQILGEMLPIRDGLSGLFFIGVGMLLDVAGVLERPAVVAAAVVAILVGKALVAGVAVLVAGYGARTAVLCGVALAQVGEFSFVLANGQLDLKLLDATDHQLFLAAAVLTMTASPFLYRGAPALAEWADRRTRRGATSADAGGPGAHEAASGHVIVVGFGLTGRNVARALSDHGLSYVAVEMNPESVRYERAAGTPILYGDAGHLAVLERAGFHGARLLVLAISDFPGTKRVLGVVKAARPDLRVIVRARYVREVAEFKALGADEVVPDEIETSVEIFARVLRAYDLPAEAIERSVRAARAEGFAAVRSTAARHGLSSSGVRVAAADIESHAVGPGAPADGKTIEELAIRRRFGVTVVGVRREGDVLPDPGADTRFRAADVVILVGSPDRLSAAASLFRTPASERAPTTGAAADADPPSTEDAR